MKLTATTFATLDGVVQGPGHAPGGRPEDPSGGFALGGWTEPYADEEFEQLTAEEFERADAFLFGRGTVRHLLRVLATRDRPGQRHGRTAQHLPPKHIASRSPQRLGWAGAVQVQGELVEAVRGLKDQPGNKLQVHGSGVLLRSLWDAGLVDEWRLRIFPVVLGERCPAVRVRAGAGQAAPAGQPDHTVGHHRAAVRARLTPDVAGDRSGALWRTPEGVFGPLVGGEQPHLGDRGRPRSATRSMHVHRHRGAVALAGEVDGNAARSPLTIGSARERRVERCRR